jgi:hypothetical protein
MGIKSRIYLRNSDPNSCIAASPLNEANYVIGDVHTFQGLCKNELTGLKTKKINLQTIFPEVRGFPQ